jgi:alcohol dehydrogenase (cytochrome c)
VGHDIWNEPIAYKKGAYLGSGFTIKTVNEDYIGAMRAVDPKTGKIVWEQKNVAPLWGGVCRPGRSGVHRHPEGYLRC